MRRALTILLCIVCLRASAQTTNIISTAASPILTFNIGGTNGTNYVFIPPGTMLIFGGTTSSVKSVNGILSLGGTNSPLQFVHSGSYQGQPVPFMFFDPTDVSAGFFTDGSFLGKALIFSGITNGGYQDGMYIGRETNEVYSAYGADATGRLQFGGVWWGWSTKNFVNTGSNDVNNGGNYRAPDANVNNYMGPIKIWSFTLGDDTLNGINPTNVLIGTFYGDSNGLHIVTSAGVSFDWNGFTFHTNNVNFTGILSGTTDSAGLITNYFSTSITVSNGWFNPTNNLLLTANVASIKTNRIVFHVLTNGANCAACVVVGPATGTIQ